MALLYSLSILCWWRTARRLGPAAGIAVAGALLVYPSYALLFHRLASDAVFAAAFALAALLAARVIESPTYGRSAALGLGVAAARLRSTGQPGALPARAARPAASRELAGPRWVASRHSRVAVLVPLLGWAAHNAVRADDFTVVRGGGHGLPLYRAFVVDRIVEPENGDATRELARAVQSDLLPREPYRSYGIDLEQFFTAGSSRMHEDLIGLSDRTWGWDDDYAHLGRVGREAVVAHPGDVRSRRRPRHVEAPVVAAVPARRRRRGDRDP